MVHNYGHYQSKETHISGVLPDRLLQSITLDRDNEFANHADITAKILNAQFYFAHPMCRWERGTNENANGQLRQYVLKDT